MFWESVVIITPCVAGLIIALWHWVTSFKINDKTDY